MTVRPLAVERAPERVRPFATWWVVFQREAVDLWVGGKGLTLILVYSLLLGIWSYVLASNTELSLIPPKEMVWEMMEATLGISCCLCIIAGADSISGDRERATLEALLLTPTSRRQIVLGKFLAVASLWFGMFAVTAPYLAVLAQGDEILRPALLLGITLGSLLALSMAGAGMLVSLWAGSIKTSMAVGLGLYLIIYLPQLLPGHMQHGTAGKLLQKVSPLMASYEFMAKVLVNHRTFAERGYLLWSPIIFGVVVLAALFLFAGGLRLEPTAPRGLRAIARRALGVLAIGCFLGAAGQANAQQNPAADPPDEPPPAGLQMSVDLKYRHLSQGDSIIYKTLVKNVGTEEQRQVTVAINIINLDATGNIVDPEDWSPRRTQYIDRLAPGRDTTLTWRVNAIIDGDYMVYMVAIPRPAGPQVTSQMATCSGIHMIVAPATKLNPRGILMYVVGTPILLMLGMFYLYRRRKRATEGS